MLAAPANDKPIGTGVGRGGTSWGEGRSRIAQGGAAAVVSIIGSYPLHWAG